MAYQGRFNSGGSQRAPKRRGGAWKIVLAVVLTVIITLALVVGVAWWYLTSKLGKVTQAEFIEKDTTGQDLSALIGNLDEDDPTISISVTEATEATEPDYGESGRVVNILVVGQDSREGEEHKLADGIMLLTLNKEARTLTMTSFLRDSYVKLPESYRGHTCGWNRINTAYALGYVWYDTAGAMEMLDITLANNFGVNVDGNIEVSFDTFITVVDYLGGVEIDLEGDEYTRMAYLADYYNNLYGYYGTENEIVITEGVNNLDGFMALEYARERHMNDADNDMNRVQRQQKVLSKMVEKCTTLSALELNELIDKVLAEIITDLTTEELQTYVTELTPYIFDLTLISNQCPADGTYWGEMVELPDGEGGVLKIDFEANKKLLEPILNGESTTTEETTAEETATEETTAETETEATAE